MRPDLAKSVWTLWFSREPEFSRDESQLLGIYSTEDLANKAMERAALLPEFKKTPEDQLGVYHQPLDWDDWTTGFSPAG
jgi:hypothetical protein